MGRSLERERSLKGLTVADISARTGLPQVMLDALEAGTVDRLPDRVQTIKTLRGYADTLGLPGDAYAMLLIDLWPSYGGSIPPVAMLQGAASAGATSSALSRPPAPAGATHGSGETLAIPLVAPGAAGGGPPGGAGLLAPAEPVGVANGGTGSNGPAVRRVGGTSPLPDGTAQVPLVFADTGVTPAVGPMVRRRRGPTGLQIVLIVVALALLVGVAGLVVDRVHRQWLDDIGVLSNPSTPHAVPPPTHGTTPPPPTLALVSHSSTGATFTVREPSFQVKVVTVGGPSWIQGTEALHPTPVYTGVIGVGQSKTFDVTQSLNLQVGSSSARVFVSAGPKQLGFYFPPSAPFTLVFRRVG